MKTAGKISRGENGDWQALEERACGILNLVARLDSKSVLAVVSMTLIACASPSTETSEWTQTDFRLKLAQRAYARGNLKSALRHSSSAMDSEVVTPEAIGLHLRILREVGRQAEADALSDFLERSEAGEETGEDAARQFEDECRDRWRDLAQSKRLVRGWDPGGYWPDFDPTGSGPGHPLQAWFEVGPSARPSSIRVERAENPGEAWQVVRIIGEAKIRKARLQKLDSSELPVLYCVSLRTDTGREPGARLPDFNIRGKGPGSL